MAIKNDPFHIDKTGRLLFIGSAARTIPWDKVKQKVELVHKDFEMVGPLFWDYQCKWIPAAQHYMLAGVKESQGQIEFPAFPFLQRLEEFPFFLQTMLIYKGFFKNQSFEGVLPETSFYSTQESIGRVTFNHKLKSLPHSKENIIEEIVGNRIEYFSNNPGYLDCSSLRLDIQSPFFLENQKSKCSLLVPSIELTSRKKLLSHIQIKMESLQQVKNPCSFSILHSSEISPYLERLNPEKVLFCQGKIPIEGVDSRLEILVKVETPKAGEENFYNYKQYITVSKGDELALKYHYIEGEDGSDVHGHIIKVKKGKDIQISIEGPIEAIPQGNVTKYIASESGLFIPSENSLLLEESFIVEGDVDFHTGNIDFEKNVEIKGDVKAGFHITSKENVIIHGCIENGAQIKAGGTLSVFKGVLGEDTIIRSTGVVHLDYMQDATIYSESDVFVNKTVMGGVIFCIGQLVIEGNGVTSNTHGAILGGEYHSFNKMILHSLGSNSKLSSFHLGVHWLNHEKRIEAEKLLALLERRQLGLMKDIPVDLSTPEGRNALSNLRKTQVEKLKDNLQMMKKVAAMREDLQNKLNSYIQGEFAEKDKSLEIDVDNMLFGKNIFYRDSISKEIIFENRSHQILQWRADSLEISPKI